VGREDRRGLAGGIHAAQWLTLERERDERLRADLESRWREPFSAPCCCLSADQVASTYLLKAAEGCMALTDQLLRVVNVRHAEQIEFSCIMILGFIYVT
jgi:hypothetical protein